MTHTKATYWIGLVTVSIFLLLYIPSCTEAERIEVKKEIVHADADGYVGSESCKACHQQAWEGYKKSHHYQAMQHATKEFVLGDFDSVEVTLDGETYLMYTQNDTYFVRGIGESGEVENMEVKYTFGFTPLQQYLVEFSKGKRQCLRITWDSEKKEWFHQYAGDEIDFNNWLHWTKGGQNWNTMCASCHSTNLQKNYDLASDSFATTYSEITVGCESCHGPGKNHMEWAKTGKSGEAPSIKALNTSSKQQIESCAPCHARRTSLTATFTPGEAFHNQFRLQTINTDFYHADGQIKEEDYVYGSFVQSKMYAADVKCTDCHDPHSYELKETGNQLCLQCHVPETYDTPGHHFHEQNTAGSQCINCHMTGQYYMGNDFRRDHSFRVPRPDQTVTAGTPNACNECHTDKKPQWAADQITKWYGEERPDHFSNTLQNGRPKTPEQRAQLLGLIQGNYPAIAKATAMEYLSAELSPTEREAIAQQLHQQDAGFIYEYLITFLNYPPEDRIFAAEFLGASERLTRIGAALLLVDVPPTALPPGTQNNWNAAQRELETYLTFNADFAIGRVNLGNYYLRKKNSQKALLQYKMALAKDSLIQDAYLKMATTLSILNQNEEALLVLKQSLSKFDNNAQTYYFLGLLEIQLGKTALGISYLKQCIAEDPNHFKANYNLSLVYFKNKDYSTALQYIEQALEAYPYDQNALQLKLLIYRDSGNQQKAQQLMNEINATYSGTTN